jgi:hypothetical protein
MLRNYKNKKILLHAMTQDQDLDQQWEHIFIGALIPCLKYIVHPHMVNVLRKTLKHTKTNKYTDVYAFKILNEGNNP